MILSCPKRGENDHPKFWSQHLEAVKCRRYTQSFEPSSSVVPRSKACGGEKTLGPILMINWQTVLHACCSVVPRLRPRKRFHRTYKAGQRPSLGSVRMQLVSGLVTFVAGNTNSFYLRLHQRAIAQHYHNWSSLKNIALQNNKPSTKWSQLKLPLPSPPWSPQLLP